MLNVKTFYISNDIIKYKRTEAP